MVYDTWRGVRSRRPNEGNVRYTIPLNTRERNSVVIAVVESMLQPTEFILRRELPPPGNAGDADLWMPSSIKPILLYIMGHRSIILQGCVEDLPYTLQHQIQLHSI